jgi:hypothetical protein
MYIRKLDEKYELSVVSGDQAYDYLNGAKEWYLTYVLA